MDYDLALHNTRVLNDGGSVPNPIQAESYIKYLKENNLWDSCVFFGLGGSKIEPNTDNSCRKLYDLKGNADVFNVTATGQPRYNQDGTLQYDGGDYLRSDILLVGNPIRESVTQFTIIFWIYPKTSATLQTILSRVGATSATQPFNIVTNASNILTVVLRTSVLNGALSGGLSQPLVNDTWNHVAISVDMLASGNNRIKCYLNGIDSSVSVTGVGTGLMQNLEQPLRIGGRDLDTQYPLINGSKVALPQIYNTTFTAEQILQNFNNIKPTDISEMYGSLTGAHINRVETSFGSIPVVDKVQSTIDKLKSANLWDSCVFFADAKLGVKKDSNQYVNAVYDLKANADLLQSTATRQPKYDNGNLLYDGGDTLNSSTLPTNNPIRTAVSNFTIIGWVKMPATSGIKSFFNRYNSTNYPWILSTGTISPYYNTFRCLLSDSAGAMKFYYTTNTIADNTWHRFAVTFSPNNLKMYVDNTECTYIKNTDAVVNSVRNIDNALNFGVNNSLTPDMPNGSQSALYQIYNSTFTNEQLTWNYNNIRPEGV